jgi:hypothetical protein
MVLMNSVFPPVMKSALTSGLDEIILHNSTKDFNYCFLVCMEQMQWMNFLERSRDVAEMVCPTVRYFSIGSNQKDL